MTSEELYYLAKLQLTKLGTGVGQLLEPDMFVYLFNRTQIKWMQLAVATKLDSQNRDKLAPLLVIDKPVDKTESGSRFSLFSLPEQSYLLTGVRASCTKNECHRDIYSAPRSSQWIEANWGNSLVAPSFDWEETYHTQAGENLYIYQSDFSISKAYLSYYKTPPVIDLPGYINLSNQASTLINSPLSDEALEEILNLLLTTNLPIN